MPWDRDRHRGNDNRRNDQRHDRRNDQRRDFDRRDRPPQQGEGGGGGGGGGGRRKIEPFALFCAYHLGITENDGYKFQNIHQVARRFNVNAAEIKQMLIDYGMDPETVVNSGYDMAAAQVDIMVAPEGISRTELARNLFEEFQQAPRKQRDWKKELEEDARENEKTFGRR